AADMADIAADEVDKLLGDERQALVFGMEELSHRDRCRGVLPDQPEALLVLGPERVFQEEKMERLQLLRKTGRLDRREPLMDVMEELDLITHLISKVGEHPRDDPKVAGRLPVRLNCRNWTSVSPSRCGCLSCTANAIRPACSRHRALD